MAFCDEEILEEFLLVGQSRFDQRDREMYSFRDLDCIRVANANVYAGIRKNPYLWAAHLKYRRNYLQEKRRDPKFLAQERGWRKSSYERLKADPTYLPSRNAKSRTRYADLRADPSKRERYERVLAAARERWRRRKNSR